MEFLKPESLDGIVTSVKYYLPYAPSPVLKWAAISIMFNPFFWNVVGRAEFKFRVFTRLTGGSKYRACYVFAGMVFSLGLLRDYLFYEALQSQPRASILDNQVVKWTGIVTAAAGHLLAVSSMWALGITGTYLGDYFGILMDEKVARFPFNICENPMYNGSTLTFLGVALYNGKVLGVALSALVWTIYQIGLHFEEPFTSQIYSNRKLD